MNMYCTQKGMHWKKEICKIKGFFRLIPLGMPFVVSNLRNGLLLEEINGVKFDCRIDNRHHNSKFVVCGLRELCKSNTFINSKTQCGNL